jgi:phosphatidylserine synthase
VKLQQAAVCTRSMFLAKHQKAEVYLKVVLLLTLHPLFVLCRKWTQLKDVQQLVEMFHQYMLLLVRFVVLFFAVERKEQLVLIQVLTDWHLEVY